MNFDWLDGAIGMWLTAAALGCLPEPLEGERWYGALYKFCQVVAANLTRLKKPNGKA